MKTLSITLLMLLGSYTLTAQRQSTTDSIAHTLLVANYEYSCRSTDAQGKELSDTTERRIRANSSSTYPPRGKTIPRGA
mgnify:CR=1 FL=1